MFVEKVSRVTICHLSRVLATAALTIGVANFGLAQNTNSGDIRGTVTDASGAVIPGVAVTLLNTNTGVSKELVTNSAGLYDAVSILPGQYTITFPRRVSRKSNAAASTCRWEPSAWTRN